MSTSPYRSDNLTINASERRPSSFLGGNLDTTEMDPDLMMASAEMGGYFQLPEWNASNTAVHEYEVAEPYEDEEAERLLLRRTKARRSLCPVAVEHSLAGESTVAICSSEAVGRRSRKRRFSSRVGEGLKDLEKAVKKRTDSWSWRKDSMALAPSSPPPAAALLGERFEESASSEGGSLGSGERSRDGDDEMSSGEEQVFRRRQTRSWNLFARRPVQTGPVSGGNGGRAHNRQVLPVQPPVLLAHNHEQLQLTYDIPRLDLAIMERGVRIAERQGAFSSATREKTFKLPHRRLGSESSQQSQASIMLKTKLAREKAESDRQFRRLSEDRDESPVRKVFNKLWRRNGRGKESVVESAAPSSLESSAENFTSSATQSSGEVSREDRADRQRGDNVEAAAHAGRAVQQGVAHAGMPFIMF
jgi:hypothetical protein